MKKVIRTEMHLRTIEVVIKSKKTDYKNGGFYLVETIRRTAIERPRAILECGHFRDDVGQQLKILAAKRLTCWECEER